ncbi:RiPP maturation radical SAM C-methyltransferase [Streptomyces collinus]|uniref:RiPP maturation radical SAM C-methyltransferase n=1 Tax=Streptomyces collinus TaxID=42684 RepID=UPI003678BA98
MKVVLVNSPWATLEMPSLALGILRSAVMKKIPDAEVDVINGQLEYFDWISGRGSFNRSSYESFSNYDVLSSGDAYENGHGEWIFSSALYDDPEWRLKEFYEENSRSMSKDALENARSLHEGAPEFVAELAGKIAELEPDVVGFTSTFQQNTAALATAKYIKRLLPAVKTVMGGANCDGDLGAARHRNFSFVDFVVRGEGEVVFPQLISEIAGNQDFANIPGLCWWDQEGVSVANPTIAKPLLPTDIVSPEYDEFYERLNASAAKQWVQPRLIVESSRGCWWGEKHHCTFCGLNGSFMEFRSKSPDRFYNELLELVRRHKILDIEVVDNIIDISYINTLLPRLVETGYDLRLFYEVKSNLKKEQLELLRKSGTLKIQPGIENLSSRVLKIMDKGVSGCQNVRTLRDAESLGLTVSWYYLYGFPGEEPADYETAVEQMPAIHHLQPCGGQTRILIERFSPYFNKPELGFSDLRPSRQYELVYDLPADELFDMAYTFDAPPLGIDGTTVEELSEAIKEWQANYANSRLVHWDMEDSILLANNRPGFDWTVMTITEPLHLAVFRSLEQPRSVENLHRRLPENITADESAEVLAEQVALLLEEWRQLGLVYVDAGQAVHVATTAENQHLLAVPKTA